MRHDNQETGARRQEPGGRRPRRFLALCLALPLAAFAQQAPDKPAQQPPDKPVPAAPDKPAQETPAAPPAKADDKPASPAPAAEGWINGSFDFAYRWVSDVRGSFQEYRSVVNLGEGLRVSGFDFTIRDPKKRLFDSLTVRGMGFNDPYATVHLDARKSKLYDLRFDYRSIAYFNAVPSFANPVAPAGFNEQSFDTWRRDINFEFDLFPTSRVVPYLAYDRDSGHGRGIDTWVLGATDEFPVPYTLRDSTHNYRGGVRFEFNRLHITLEQGGTTFRDDDATTFTGPEPGDRTTPANGTLLSLYGLQQAYGIRGNSVYSKALLTARPASWLNVYGQFLYSDPHTDVSYTELANGNFLNFATLLLYNSQSGIAGGNAVQPHVSGNVAAEARWRRLRVIESFTTDREHDSALGLFSQQLSAPATTSSSTTSINPLQVVHYNQSQTDVFYDLTPSLTLRGGYRYLSGDAVVLAGVLSQVGTSLSGQLRRDAGLAGLTFRPSEKFSANIDYEGASSDRVYFRTSLNDYQKARLRARYQAASTLVLQANFRVLNNQNPAPDIRLDFQSRTNSLAAFWTPKGGKRIAVTAQYDRTTVRSSVAYLDLPFLSPAVSDYRDNAHTATAAIDIALPAGARLSAGGSMFLSNGSRPTQYYQPQAKLSIPLQKHILWNTEWQYYGFGENFYLFEGFRTHLFMTGFRVTR